MRRGLLLMLAIAASFAGTARAADIAQLTCPLDALTPEGRANLGALGAARGSYEDPAMRAFIETHERCATNLGWDTDEREGARLFGLASLARDNVRAQLVRDGYDVAALDRAMSSDPALNRAMRSPDFSERDIQGFLQRNAVMIVGLAGARGTDQRVMERVGLFMAMRATAEAGQHRFTGQ